MDKQQTENRAGWSQAEAVDFARFSARTALDQTGEWGSLQESVDNYRENVRDTLAEYRAAQYEADAFAAFDAVVAEGRAAVEACLAARAARLAAEAERAARVDAAEAEWHASGQRVEAACAAWKVQRARGDLQAQDKAYEVLVAALDAQLVAFCRYTEAVGESQHAGL